MEAAAASATDPGAGTTAPAGYVRSFNRFELKYIVEVRKAEALLDALAAHCTPDPHAGEDGYRVHSVYWDAPDLACFWEKVDGQKYRRKVRVRRYGEPEEAGGQVFLEIKQRLDRTVQKRRVRMGLEHARALLGDGRIDPELEARERDPVAMEALFLCRYHRMQPTMAVAYRRRAFVGAHEHDLRITLDTRLTYDARQLDPGGRMEPGKGLLDPRLAVVEVKFADRAPLWLCRAVEHHALELVRLSKYCAAVDREHFGGRYT